MVRVLIWLEQPGVKCAILKAVDSGSIIEPGSYGEFYKVFEERDGFT